MCATSVTLSYFHVHTAINILRCFGHPREHNFGLVLILSQTGCTEGCVYFPQSCRNTHLPHFLDCLLNTTLIPCLLVFFPSRTSVRLIQQSTKFGNRHTAHGRYEYSYNLAIALTHVRTGPKKKKIAAGPLQKSFLRPCIEESYTSEGTSMADLDTSIWAWLADLDTRMGTAGYCRHKCGHTQAISKLSYSHK